MNNYFERVTSITSPLFRSNLLPYLLLCLISTAIYAPFFSHNALGANDAQWYHAVLKDILLQYQQGIFPVYIGQTAFNFIGAPVGMASGYAFLGVLLDIISLHKLTAIDIQHLMVIVIAAASIVSMYTVLYKLAPHMRWAAFLFAFFYVSCPAIIGTMSHFDAYRSFLSLPFIPILIYGLIRIYQKQKFIHILLVSMSLSLIWLAHPPVGFWASIFCGIFYLSMWFTIKKGLRAIFLTGFIFLLLSAWQFIFTFSCHLQTDYLPQLLSYADTVMVLLKQIIPGVFLPVNWSHEQMAPLQLGFALWFLLGMIVYTLKYYTNALLRNLFLCISVFFVLLYPIPFLTHFLYAHMPRVVENMTSQWPMLRLYFILAPLLLFAGFLALNDLSQKTDNKQRYIKIIFWLCILALWSTIEVGKFTAFMFDSISTEKTTLWQLPENYLFVPSYGGTNTHWPEGSYDPTLETRLLDSNLKPIPSFDNKITVINKCLASNSKEDSVILKSKFPIENTPTRLKTIELLRFTLDPKKHYATCFELISQYCPGIFHIEGLHHHTMLYNQLGSYSSSQNNVTKQILLLSSFTTETKPKSVEVQFIADPQSDKKAFVKFIRYGKTQYDNTNLPIHIKSIFPFIANVDAPFNRSYLETYRFYLPGYEAVVNHHQVKVLQSPNNTVLIPLEKGTNQITLNYIATPWVRISFYISLFSWIAALTILLQMAVLQKILFKPQRIDSTEAA